MLFIKSMGIAGTALATNIARLTEILIIVLAIYIKKLPIAASFAEMRLRDKTLIHSIADKMLPPIGNELFYTLGLSATFMVYGRMGASVMAVITIVQTIEQFMMRYHSKKWLNRLI